MIELHNADCFNKLRELEDNSVDSVVTDPPYFLSFMGKDWDKLDGNIAANVEFWKEVLRVLKPGGHLLAFGHSRTHHRLYIAIEDAGFEIRDTIMWLYGSGFPKSHDISKAIDKHGGSSIAWFGTWLREWREENNISQKQIASLFPSKTGGLTGCVANWELGLSLPTAKQFSLICKTFNLPFETIEEAKREITGSKISGIANKEEKERHTVGASKAVRVDITAPATDEAKRWEGWGTALKPAHEPICLARKPLEGTVATNVLKHGVGGLNIDESRIATSKEDVFGGGAKGTSGFAAGYEGDGFVNGVILGLVSVRADLTYQQGPARMWSRSTRYDFYFPAFATWVNKLFLIKKFMFVAIS